MFPEEEAFKKLMNQAMDLGFDDASRGYKRSSIGGCFPDPECVLSWAPRKEAIYAAYSAAFDMRDSRIWAKR